MTKEFPSNFRTFRAWHKTQRMPEIIFDCCCISNFALADSSFILKNLYSQSAVITNFVSAEILRGIQQGHKDLLKVQEALKEGWLKEISLSSKKEKSLLETLSVSLGLGEASSIAAAKSRSYIFACDDRAARREAMLLEVKLSGTIGILRKAVKRKIINLNEGNRILTKMVKTGFYSPLKSLTII
jgi:predicted nucleic acid-binding protein